MAYQPRRTLAGFSAEQSASIYHALQELADEARTRRDASTAILTGRVDLRTNQFARLSPPASGQVAVLPHPLRTSPGDEVVLSVEAPLGTLTVAVAPSRDDTGQIRQGTINGQRRLTFLEAGEARFRSNGKDKWLFAAEVPAEVTPAASSSAAAAASAALSARYHLQTADASLPNARVARTSDEIEVDYGTTGFVSWVVRDGSIVADHLASDVTLAEVLSRGDETLANDIHVSTGQQLIFDVGGDGLGDIQSLGTLTVRTASTMDFQAAAGNVGFNAAAGNFNMSGLSQLNMTVASASGYVRMAVGGVNRFWFTGTGALAIGAAADRGTTGELFISQGNTTPIWGQATTASIADDAVTLPKIEDIAAESFLMNPTASSASPTARAGSSVAGDGLTYTAGGTLAVGQGSYILVNANDVAWGGFDLGVSGVFASGGWKGIDVSDSATVEWSLSAPGDGRLGLALGVVANSIGPTQIDETATYTWTGGHEFEDTVHLAGVFSGTLTGTTSNLAIGAVNTARLSLSALNGETLTGMVPTADGQLVFIQNVDTTGVLTLAHDSTSTAANRFYLPGGVDYGIQLNGGALVRYDATLQRWVLAVPRSQGISISHAPVTSLSRTSLTFTEGSGVNIVMATSDGDAEIDVALDLAEDLAWTGDYTHAGTNEFNSLSTFDGNAIFNGIAAVAQVVALSGTAFDTVIAATENDMDPGDVSIVWMRASGASTLTGMVPSTTGHVVWLYNRDPSDVISIAHQSASSAVANRFNCPGSASFALQPFSGVVAYYSGASLGWLLFSR